MERSTKKTACGETRLGVAPGSAEREKLFWLDDDSRTALSKRIRAVRWRRRWKERKEYGTESESTYRCVG